MPMTLEEMWRLAADDLSLELTIPFQFVTSRGAQIDARVLVRGFGARQGMLLVRDYTDVSRVDTELVDAGYGYCVMDDPLLAERYDRANIIDVLRDWGWSGPPERAPRWLTEK